MTDAISIGDLRHRVRIEREVRTSDGGGGASVTWTLVAEVSAAIFARNASEGVSLDRAAGIATYDVWMRHRSDVTPAMRLTHEGRVFNIQAAVDVDGRRRWLKCTVEARDL